MASGQLRSRDPGRGPGKRRRLKGSDLRESSTGGIGEIDPRPREINFQKPVCGRHRAGLRLVGHRSYCLAREKAAKASRCRCPAPTNLRAWQMTSFQQVKGFSDIDFAVVVDQAGFAADLCCPPERPIKFVFHVMRSARLRESTT
jgi:hypothetical protein